MLNSILQHFTQVPNVSFLYIQGRLPLKMFFLSVLFPLACACLNLPTSFTQGKKLWSFGLLEQT